MNTDRRARRPCAPVVARDAESAGVYLHLPRARPNGALPRSRLPRHHRVGATCSQHLTATFTHAACREQGPNHRARSTMIHPSPRPHQLPPSCTCLKTPCRPSPPLDQHHSGTYSGQIVLWDTRAKSLPVQRTPLSAAGHTHPVYSLALAPAAGKVKRPRRSRRPCPSHPTLAKHSKASTYHVSRCYRFNRTVSSRVSSHFCHPIHPSPHPHAPPPSPTAGLRAHQRAGLCELGRPCVHVEPQPAQPAHGRGRGQVRS